MARVAMIAFTHYDSDPRVRREAETLAAAGHDVTVFCLSHPGDTIQRTLEGVRLRGIRVPRHRGDSQLTYLFQYLAFFFMAMFRLARLHIRSRQQIVHVHTMPDFMVFAALPAKLFGARVILDMHDLMPELYASKFGRSVNHPLIRMVTLVERWSFAFADQVLAVHDLHKDAIVAHGNRVEKINVVMNVPDPRLFPFEAALRTAGSNGPIVAGYHGTLAPRHGLGLALRAVHARRNQLKGLKLLILGDGDDVPHLQSIIEELSLGDLVDLRQGFVPVDQLLPDLLTIDFGVIPVIADEFTRLMLPTKLLEYGQLGIPSICTALPAVELYFENDQVSMVRSGDISDLGDRIVELYSDASQRRAMAKRAMTFFETHGWEQERGRFERIVERLS